MEQLRIRADWFRKQGRLCNEDIDKIIKEMKANEETIDDNTDRKAANTSNNENRRVMEAVETGLVQIHGTAPNTKQHGIFRIMGENCNGFNNRIGGNHKLTKAIDIKEDLDIDCFLYCEHCLNFRHKDNKNNLKQMFQRELHAQRSALIMCMRQRLQGKCKKGGRGLFASANWWDTSGRQGKMTKGLEGGVGYSSEGIINTRQGSSQLITRARTRTSTPKRHTSNSGGTSSLGKRTSPAHLHYFSATS
jgi:hypothetical protein